jgi:hypothetical protein
MMLEGADSLPAKCFISHAYADAAARDAFIKILPLGVAPFVFPPITVKVDEFVSDPSTTVRTCRGLWTSLTNGPISWPHTRETPAGRSWPITRRAVPSKRRAKRWFVSQLFPNLRIDTVRFVKSPVSTTGGEADEFGGIKAGAAVDEIDATLLTFKILL